MRLVASFVAAGFVAFACIAPPADIVDSLGPGGATGAGGGTGGSSKGGNGGSSDGSGGSAAGSGGSSTGGKGGNGGSAGSSGASGGSSGSAGAGGSPSGGSAGVGGGGAGSGGTSPDTTPGCGKASWPPSGQLQSLDISSTQREFSVALPASYDPGQAYRVVFAWHFLNGTIQEMVSGNYYGLRTATFGRDSTIFVAAQGLVQNNFTGWWNTGGGDVALFDAIVSWLGDAYCIDTERMFSVGFSIGGMFSHLLGCERYDVLRAIAVISGYRTGPAGACGAALPAWIAHGTIDATTTITQGRAVRDTWIETNGCGATSSAVAPNPCVAYDGCGAPVHWCEHGGDHTVPSFAAQGVWSFFAQF